jgi:hypothetical protein
MKFATFTLKSFAAKPAFNENDYARMMQVSVNRGNRIRMGSYQT